MVTAPLWPMRDADARGSRRSGAVGPAAPRLRWTSDAGGGFSAFSEPLVTADGRIVLAGSGRTAGTVVLGPEGAVLQALPGMGAAEVAPVLLTVAGQEVLVTSAEEPLLVAVAMAGLGAGRRWTRELAHRPEFLRGTPGGDVLVFSREDRFLCVSRHGAPKWGALQDLTGTKGAGFAAFDGQGHCYTAESAIVFQRGREVTWQSGVSVLAPAGEELFSELFEPTDGADLNAIQHVWGLDVGAVLFGRDVRCLEPSGTTRWAISRAEEFAGTVRVEGTALLLGWDPRLVGGPRLVQLHDGGFRYLAATVDAEGNAYACDGRTVFSLDRDGRSRWTFALPEAAVGGPVVAASGALLIRGAGTLYALG